MKTTYNLIQALENGERGHVEGQTVFRDLEKAFQAFNNLDLSDLEEGAEYELVKYDEDGTAIDWDKSELESLNWELNTWVTRS